MDWDWIPALSTTTGFAAILWILRNWITARLTGSIQHEYDEKLEALKSDLQNNEARFKADLSAKESQIESLRTTVLSNVTRRQDLVFEKQLQAIDKVWGAVLNLGKGKNAAISLSVIKFKSALEEAEKNPRMREFAKVVGSGVELDSFNITPALEARPFVSILVWAYFSAYQAIIFHALTKLHLLKTGINNPEIVENEKIVDLVKTALPHHKEYIDKQGPEAFHFFLEELESLILSAFRLMLKGEELDKDAIEKASSIIKQAEELMAKDESKTSEESAP